MRRSFVFLAAVSLVCTAATAPQTINTAASVITVRVFKAGLFSVFGHDHEITAPVAVGSVDAANQRVEVHINASALRVVDSKGSAKDRDEVQKTMLGPDVLNVERYPEIVFRSTSVESAGPGSWRVRGELALHGQTRPASFQVTERAEHYVGHALIKQTDFGIKPVRAAGGTIQTKDEIRIEFDIRLGQ